MNNFQSTINYQPSIIFLVGPTATGKSSIAFQLAEKHNAHILSADSRQIYQGLEVTSGADIPQDFVIPERGPDKIGTKYQGSPMYFQDNNGTKLFGVSFLPPTETWSIAQFREYAFAVIDICKSEQKNLIIVGGSGLYLESLNISDNQVNTPPNEELRKELEKLSVPELQHRLNVETPSSLRRQGSAPLSKQMNNSDWNNPRRLIRAIEIATNKSRDAKHRVLMPASTPTLKTYPQQWIGFQMEKDLIEQRIHQRVEERITQGAVQEVEKLLDIFADQKLPAYTTTGVKEIIAYLRNACTTEELIERWTTREFQYAKRQITWFKKRPQIQWFDAVKPIDIGQLQAND